MALQYIDLQTLSSLIFMMMIMMMIMMMFSMMASPEERETKVIAYVYPTEEKAKKKKI